MWKPSEQYEAIERDAWGDDTSSNDAPICVCNINSGCTCCTCTTATGGYTICKSSGTAWVVAPSSTEVCRAWYWVGDAATCAAAITGCGGWYVPSCGQLKGYAGAGIAEYWDSYASSPSYSSTTGGPCPSNYVVSIANAGVGLEYKTTSRRVRAFRTVGY